MNYLRNIFLIVILLFGLANNQLIKAQNSDSTLLPSIGNHIFTSITGVDDPFIKTKFILNVGIANLFNTDILLNIPQTNKTITFQPQLFYAVGGLEFQQVINDWSAIHLRTIGTARIGDNLVSIATQGISAATFFGIGMMFKLTESKDLMLSGTIDLNNTSFTYISLQGKFEDIISDSSSNQQVFNQYQILTGNMQLKFAYRFTKTLGLMANASGSYGEIYGYDSNNEINWSFGTLLSVDLKNWIHIPFGIGFGGTVVSNDWQFSTTNDPVYTVNLNISFINQDDLSIAWENYIQMFNQDQFNQTYKFHYSRLYLSYYF
jgi:hypothetical protein